MRVSANSTSQRQLRVAEQIRHALVETLQRGGFDDPALMDSALITVNEVRISPDLKNATAFVLTLGGDGMDEILPALNQAAALFQKELARKLQLKFTPRIKFETDTTFDYAQRIDTLIRQTHET